MPSRAAAGQPFTTCIGCNQGCIGHYHAGLPIACTINPWTGRERTLPRPSPDPQPRTVVVVGAGPAGAAAAACASAQGHRVVVIERSPAAGGQMRLALEAPGHAEIARGLVGTVEDWLSSADVRLGVEATAESVTAESPDRVILAAGAVAHSSGLPETLTAWEALAGAETGERVLLYDWGGDWTGLALAEQLAASGRSVRLVTSAIAFGEAVHQYQRNLYLARLDEAGVDLVHHLRLLEVEGGRARFENVFSLRRVELDGFDTVVAHEGRSAAGGELFEQLSGAGLDVVRVGDALGPRSFEEAIREGTEAGLAPLSARV